MDVQTTSESRISSESPKLPNYTSESKVSQDSTSISSFRPSKAGQSRFTWDEGHWRTAAIYCRMSQECMYVYVFLFVLNLSVLIWIFIEWEEHHVGVLILEIIITITFIGELLFNWTVDGEEYLKDWFNWIDLIVCLLCLIALLVMIVEYSSGEFGVGATVDNILIASRTLLRAVRLCIFAKKSHQTRVISKGARIDIDFGSDEQPTFDSYSGGAIQPADPFADHSAGRNQELQPNFIL